MESTRLARADGGSAEEADRQRACRGRLAFHRGARGGARRSAARPHQAQDGTCAGGCAMNADLLTQTLRAKLASPETTADFDLHGSVNDVLKEVGMSA